MSLPFRVAFVLRRLDANRLRTPEADRPAYTLQVNCERPGGAVCRLAHISCVPERVAARLRPDRQAMRLLADRDALDRTCHGVDVVDGVVEASRQPQLPSIRGHIPHIGAASSRDGPSLLDLAG